MSVTAEQVVAVLNQHRFRYTNEDELQEGIAAALAAAGIHAQREVRLSRRDRIDLLVDTIGIEVKIAGGWGRALDQLVRYAQHPRIDALVFVTSRVRRRPISAVNDVPVHFVSLAAGAIA